MAHWQMGVNTKAEKLDKEFPSFEAANGYHSVDPILGYALNFGSGDRDALMQTITINTYATNIHVVDGITSSESDVCTDPHAFYVQYSTDSTHYRGYDSATGNDLVGDMTMSAGATVGTAGSGYRAGWTTMVYTSPKAYEGLLFHFNHDAAVAVNPVQLWFGSGDSLTENSKSADFVAVELGSGDPIAGGDGQGWQKLSIGAKLTLTAHNVTSTSHSWSVAGSLKPTAVGFHATGRLKIEGTYY